MAYIGWKASGNETARFFTQLCPDLQPGDLDLLCGVSGSSLSFSALKQSANMSIRTSIAFDSPHQNPLPPKAYHEQQLLRIEVSYLFVYSAA